ncbi:hypothetical protein H072_4078 [Dactylellina haptotyla CBS 200.50]|uniref:DnaJ homologue subfamily C member 28 conserved domain-containing protein n=1 Tax=Dactylellina haptotyla (strain CBS 200.50) TaxID=1284197 RepID=S8ALF9_DACHA|nr:hypothetical protein H072_4078 [Dactylellina haptotyla CBS 200.50]
MRPLYQNVLRASDQPSSTQDKTNNEGEDGAMRRRLEDLQEESKLAEPRRYIKAIHAQESGDLPTRPSKHETNTLDALKERLSQKIQSTEFKYENARAVAYSQLSDAADKETRDTAMARPWTGTESLENGVLRSLHESKPRLKASPSSLSRRTSLPIHLAPIRRLSKNERLGSARDRAGSYPLLKKAESELNDEEREARSRMFRERFEPAARAMPNTIQGLTALANEKIEEAISKGMFKNLPKGPLERDHHAESPFIDTTEYLLNRMIQRQEIVPPWIEKQQELQREIKAFRSSMRVDWKRHVVRTIASWGGGPDIWISRAEEYARAEKIVNPDPAAAYNESIGPKLKKTTPSIDGTGTGTGESIVNKGAESGGVSQSDSQESAVPAPKANTPAVPFRDSNWEKTELSYHEVSIKNLNAMTRSYNLQAPQIAQRPFLTLRREILSCYRDVMPLIPAEMMERAKNPDYGKSKLKLGGDLDINSPDGSLLSLLSTAEKGKVYDESETKVYGLKQFWKDLFTRS